MSVRPGIDNGLASPDMDPQDLSPTNQNQFNWLMFGQWVETNGKEGQEPDMEGVKELVHLRNQWLASSSTEERRVVWKKMLSIHAEQLYSIGIISGTLQPVVVSQRLRNVPATALYAYEPGGYFGLTMPDSYWFDQSAAGQ